MPFSEFTKAELEDSELVVTGPFRFTENDPPARVAALVFVIVQGSEVASGAGGATPAIASGSGGARPAIGSWDGTIEARDLKPGPAHGFGMAVLESDESPPTMLPPFTWSGEVEITAAT
jgi:hypothetical protein